ncbi:hypothetical protein GIB67_007933, partial [Kingdonia uniflora]
MHWRDADFTCLARAWVTTSVQTNGRIKGFTFCQKVNIAFNRDPEFPTQRSCEPTKSQWYVFNAQCVENDAHKIYKGLNGGNDFKHREAYKILAREPRWAYLRDDGLNHAVNIPKNVVRRTSDNSSPGNSVGSNNLSKDPDGPPTPQSAEVYYPTPRRSYSHLLHGKVKNRGQRIWQVHQTGHLYIKGQILQALRTLLTWLWQ